MKPTTDYSNSNRLLIRQAAITLILCIFRPTFQLANEGDDHRRAERELNRTAWNTEITDPDTDGSEELFYRPAFTDSPSTKGGVWPLPQKIQYGNQNRSIRQDSITFTFKGVRDVDCDILSNAKRLYLKEWLFPSTKVPSNSTGSLVVQIHLRSKCPASNEYPQQGMNEEYRLRVPTRGDVTIDAQEVWGVLRALETLSHLIFRANGSYLIRTATIHDWPEYPVRGVLLDTSRHYLRKNMILRQIDLLAQNKMNLLHWHIVDMESFPYQSSRFPNLSRAGSYTSKHVYSKAVINEILNYARLRGVRVMVEFDTPGHMASWDGQPGLLAECRNLTGYFIPPAMLDPSVEKNYAFLASFFREAMEIFPENFIHLGGDETEFWINQCWANNPSIRRFMEAKGLRNMSSLETYYFNRLLTIASDSPPSNSDRRLVFWQEVFSRRPSTNNTIIHVWKSRNPEEQARDIAEITAAGYSVLLSACWYLNLINYGADWKEGSGKYYQCDPRAFKGTHQQKEFSRVHSIRAFLGQEHLRSLRGYGLHRCPLVDTHDPEAAWPRLHEHRCRLVGRGFRAQPINGADHCPYEWDDPV